MTFTTIVDALRWRADNQPDQKAFTFLLDGEVNRSVPLTYRDLNQRALQTAEAIRESTQVPGHPVLLLFPPGLEMIGAMFGCFYSGSIAVVADFPGRRSPLTTLETIVDDAGMKVGLSGRLADIEPVIERSEKLRQIQWLFVDELSDAKLPDEIELAPIRPDLIALLQYTSGSSGTPKGVMLSHANIAHNSSIIKKRFLQDENSRSVLWVPPSHDMGLVGGVFQPLYAGYPGTLMPPLSFLQRPSRWLQAISALRATTSAAPNFAYDLCVRKISRTQRDSLDLSSWAVAINGAEPVQPQTIERFSEYFAPCGFRPDAFCPSYGLAEGTLIVSGEKKAVQPTFMHVSTPNHAGTAPVVGCGGTGLDQNVIIVDPALGLPCKEGEMGEIWLEGASVAQGYWNRVQETQAAFDARLASTGEGPFLRTGDLGCIQGGELFVTGRLKDIIIIRGINYSPSAIEQTVERSHSALRPSSGVAITVQENNTEKLIILHELERSYLRTADTKDVFRAIRHAVAEEYGLDVQSIVLLRTASLPKTATGKTKRHSCREAYMNGALDVVVRWSKDGAHDLRTDGALAGSLSSVERHDEQLLRSWLVTRLSRQLNVPAEEIDISRPFAEYGLDSAAVVGLAGDLEDHLGRELSPTLAYDYPTIQSLCSHLTENSLSRKAARSSGD
jgi:acyl-CoA synthetase (AMP-forming)/AMP-acid ligase II/acyl carrier protein